MTAPLRKDQRRVVITFPVDRYAELKRHAHASAITMTAIINELVKDYLRAEQNAAADLTGAGLSARVDSLEKRLATLSALLAPERPRRQATAERQADRKREATRNDAPALRLDHAEQNHAAPLDQRDRAKSDDAPTPGTDLTQDAPAPSIMQINAAEDVKPEPRSQDHDEQHERAADLAQRSRVPLASSLAKEPAQNERRPLTTLERQLEQKRNATAYALHGAGMSPQAFRIQGARFI